MKTNSTTENITRRQADLHLEQREQGSIVHLSGEWSLFAAEELENRLNEGHLSNIPENLIIDGKHITKLDMAGAWLIVRLLRLREANGRNSELTGFRKEHTQLVQSLVKLTDEELPLPAEPPRMSPCKSAIMYIGETSVRLAGESKDFLMFTGLVMQRALRVLVQPKRLRVASIFRHLDEAGIHAVPIIALLGFLISVVLSYQAATQLRNYGADIFTIDLMVISILREMGVLLTAIMVAGRSGSAFAAEIGVMKLRDEIDAMKTMGMDPVEVLVLPRIIALVIAMPLLTFITDMVGLAGGAMMSITLLDIPLNQYIDRVEKVVKLPMFMVGIGKAPVFALLIALVGTFQGMRVTGSAESVGRLTTVSVVQAIFLVILANALFSVLFSKLGI